MKLRVVFALVSAFVVFSVARTASAQATRTWVSGVGDDVNPCSRTAPCKTFAGAISKTAAGGEISVLDPGGYGSVTITKAITIDGRGTLASILSSGTFGIRVQAAATDVVTIRNVQINGGTSVSPGTNGISFVSGAALHVENCAIFNFATRAIDFQPAAAATLFLKNVVASNNAAGVLVGAMGQAVISKSAIMTSGTGLNVLNGAKVTVSDSVFAGNAAYGIRAQNTAVVNMDRGLIANNGVGVQADSTVRLSDVMVGHNTTGVAGAGVVSFGNNRIAAGNATDGTPSSTIPQQ